MYEDARAVYTISGKDIKATISGGSLQAPFTKKVRAGHLSLLLEINSHVPFKADISSANVVSGGFTVIPDWVSIESKSEESKKRKKHRLPKGLFLKELENLRFEAGEAYIYFGYSAQIEGLGEFQFPLTTNIGVVETSSDTLELLNFEWNATTEH